MACFEQLRSKVDYGCYENEDPLKRRPSAQGTSTIVLSMAFLLLIKTPGLRFRTTKRRPCVSKKNCLPFNENFPAEKAYRLLESILATKYSRHKLFIFGFSLDVIKIKN